MSFPAQRRKTRQVSIGPLQIGSDRPIVVQSMTNTQTSDVRATLRQIRALAKIGCELVRVSVPDEESAQALPSLIKGSPVPLVADIHFSHRLALMAIDAGIAGLRLNPGNIQGKKRVQQVVTRARERSLCIRIGVNAGSLSDKILKRFGGPVPEALVESALEHIRILEDLDHPWIKVSLKASDVATTVESYRLLAEKGDWPLHLGITEAGTKFSGTVKTSVGLGILLAEGIGDTLRVSLAGDPRDEISVAYGILSALDLRKRGIEVIACPTCARTQINVAGIAERVEKELADVSQSLRIAVMGCIVNGPGEAKEADLGAVGTPAGVQIYKAGQKIATWTEKEVVPGIVRLARELAG